MSALCSRNFQNVKKRLDFVEIRSFYRHQNFTQNDILANSKMSYVAILDTELWILVYLGLETFSNTYTKINI